jgi:hypothetical protein
MVGSEMVAVMRFAASNCEHCGNFFLQRILLIHAWDASAQNVPK